MFGISPNRYLHEAVVKLLLDAHNPLNVKIIEKFGTDRLTREENIELLRKYIEKHDDIPDTPITRWLGWPVVSV